MTTEELTEEILDELAYSCVAWTMGSQQDETPEFQSLKAMYKQLPGNRYKAENIAKRLSSS